MAPKAVWKAWAKTAKHSEILSATAYKPSSNSPTKLFTKKRSNIGTKNETVQTIPKDIHKLTD